MSTQLTTFLCAVYILSEICRGLSFIDLPSDSDNPDQIIEEITVSTVKDDIDTKIQRRFSGFAKKQLYGLTSNTETTADAATADDYLKKKISSLIQQTVRDTTNKVRSVQQIKEHYREEAGYKAGFITSMVRKCRLMLNDLFNLAVRHKDNWKALQQLKVFEYIVHVNVDTTNLVRQLVEIHIQHLNSTNVENSKKRVVLL